MKNSIAFLLLSVLLSHSVLAQDNEAKVEEGLASIHVGLVGSWLTYEHAIGKQFTLNGQLGIEGGFWGSTGVFKYVLFPTVTLEPRFYYSFSRRIRKEKKILNNSANYVTIATTFIPDLFTISNETVEIVPQVNLIPMWGLRRTLGKRFSFE